MSALTAPNPATSVPGGPNPAREPTRNTPHDAERDAERDASAEREALQAECARLREENARLVLRVRQGEDRRRAMIHIMDDLSELNKKLATQRKAMLHILGDSEQGRRRLATQTERLDNSRRALLHILQDSHQSNLRLENSRKAMIHIMDDLRETTQEMERREQELREKQEQLVQAGKLATLGELTTGVAHELNNPLNNIGLFIGNAIDHIEFGMADQEQVLRELHSATQQVRKATEIISHLRTFGRAATVSRAPVAVNQVLRRALALMREQLRLRQIQVQLDLTAEDPIVIGNAIQLEQVFINLLTNARDALADAPRKVIRVAGALRQDEDRDWVELAFHDSGPGIPAGLEQRIFDPFFTTKEVGMGTGLGLSITYSLIREHQGTIAVVNQAGHGATFVVRLPLAGDDMPPEPVLISDI
ncbi:MAG TPA: ATP-binding protein [Ktedonobacterales bacterium]